jgi:hypothetical protein
MCSGSFYHKSSHQYFRRMSYKGFCDKLSSINPFFNIKNVMNHFIHLELYLGQMMKDIVSSKHWFFAFHIRLCNQISVILTYLC